MKELRYHRQNLWQITPGLGLCLSTYVSSCAESLMQCQTQNKTPTHWTVELGRAKWMDAIHKALIQIVIDTACVDAG